VGLADSPFERFVAFRAFGAVLAFSPEADYVYFVTDLSGQYNLWRVAAGGGWPEQLTAFTDWTVRLAALSQAGDRLAFCADHDGDEFHQIFLAEPRAAGVQITGVGRSALRDARGVLAGRPPRVCREHARLPTWRPARPGKR
jgi:hypothetical protein